MIGQSARNNYKIYMLIQNEKIGSSETLRETTFNFYNFNNFHLPRHKKNIDQKFLEWFVGFSEGDGSFIVSKPKVGKPRLFFVLVQDDIQALYNLRFTIGFGKVGKHGQYFRYVVSKKRDIDRLIELFNGNLVLDKTNSRFIRWLKYRNALNVDLPAIVYKQQKENFKFLRSGWLSGFTAAEGCFNVSLRTTGRIDCRIILYQKGEETVLNNIKDEIGSGSLHCRSGIDKHFVYSIQKVSHIEKLLDYFKSYPLRVKKNVSLRRMSKMINYKKIKKEIPWEGKVKKRVLRLVRELSSEKVDDKVRHILKDM
jgi:hypothetical protein